MSGTLWVRLKIGSYGISRNRAIFSANPSF